VLQQSQRLRRELNSHERGFAAGQGGSGGTAPAHDSTGPNARPPGTESRLRAQSQCAGLDTKRWSRRAGLPRQRAAEARAISQFVGPPQQPSRVPLGIAYQADSSEGPRPRRLEDTWPHRFLRGAARECRSARAGAVRLAARSLRTHRRLTPRSRGDPTRHATLAPRRAVASSIVLRGARASCLAGRLSSNVRRQMAPSPHSEAP
jgi:hypothetical protein